MEMTENRLRTMADDLIGVAGRLTHEAEIPQRAIDLIARECGLEFAMDEPGRAKMATVLVAAQLMCNALATMLRTDREERARAAAALAAAVEKGTDAAH